VDLLIVIGALAVLGTLLILCWPRGHGLPHQAACMANLSAIGKSVVMYSVESNDKYRFPLLRSSGDPNAPLSAGTVAEDIWSPDLGANGMQNVWLLVQQNFLSQAAFHCPSDEQWQKRASTAKFGWAGLSEFSYGVQYPYASDAAGLANAATPAVTAYFDGPEPESSPASSPQACKSDSVIFADRNPGGTVDGKRLPSNHRGDGQAVLKADISVSFYKSLADSNAGLGGDDIYTNAKGVAGGVPVNDKDTSITPVPSK
jgi:hypothetical protein